MLLGLSKIIDCPGASLPFSTGVDLSDLMKSAAARTAAAPAAPEINAEEK